MAITLIAGFKKNVEAKGIEAEVPLEVASVNGSFAAKIAVNFHHVA